MDIPAEATELRGELGEVLAQGRAALDTRRPLYPERRVGRVERHDLVGVEGFPGGMIAIEHVLQVEVSGGGYGAGSSRHRTSPRV